MNSTSLGNDNHINDALATVGDAILKSLIADFLYINVSQLKVEITELKTDLENNSTLHSIEMNTGIIKFAHNDKHFYCDENVPNNEQVFCREHDSYLEAIVGAIYYDSGFFSVKKWFMNYLYNELGKKLLNVLKVIILWRKRMIDLKKISIEGQYFDILCSLNLLENDNNYKSDQVDNFNTSLIDTIFFSLKSSQSVFLIFLLGNIYSV